MKVLLRKNKIDAIENRKNSKKQTNVNKKIMKLKRKKRIKKYINIK